MSTPSDLVGKIIFTCKPESASQYDAGEYIVLGKSPYALMAVKTVVGYGGHEIKSLPLCGEERHEIVDSCRDDEYVRQFAADLMAFALDGLDPTTKPEWVKSVYTGAKQVARRLHRLLHEPACDAVPRWQDCPGPPMTSRACCPKCGAAVCIIKSP